MPSFDYENACRDAGFPLVCGVDEAGRGPLCGPVTAAAVILHPGDRIEGLNDSKKLTEKKREALFDIIKERALAYAIASASPEEIDRLNILNATMLAMSRAINALEPKPDFALIDGNTVRNIPVPARGIIKGDSLSFSIAAASVLAKVTRDRLCLEQDRLYPEYGIAVHKGYPTPAHKAAVIQYGPSPIHRRSFLKFLEQ